MYAFTLRFASVCLLGIAFSGSRVSAWCPSSDPAPHAPPQTEPADESKTVAPPKQDSKATDQPKTPDKSVAGEKLRPEVKQKVKPDPKAKAKADAARRAAKKKRKRKPTFELNPDAKWACDQQAATLEPVWRGQKTLTFPFLIRNDGTADLRIRAKGG